MIFAEPATNLRFYVQYRSIQFSNSFLLANFGIMDSTRPIIFFDGVCNLCNRSIQFVIARDQKEKFLFSSLQSIYAQKVLGEFGLDLSIIDSFVLFDGGKIYLRSTAALRVAAKLGGYWPLLRIFLIVPPFIRDFIYTYIAKRRYRWFGKQDSCWLPNPSLSDRFIS